MTSSTSAEPTRRDFLFVATGAVGAVGAVAVAWPLISQMNPDASTIAAGAPIDVDLATNSQAPSVNSFVATTEKLDSGTATIAVKMTRDHETPRANAADDVERYDFVRDGGHWKIDDIRGATDGKPWSVRGLLTYSLKN